MINLRVFIPAQSPEEATPYEDQYRKLLGDLANIHTQTKDQYWKIPELYELFFRCRAHQDEYDAFLHMANRIGANPSESSDVEFIWSANTDPNTFLTIEGTYWAHLEIYDHSDDPYVD